MFARIVDALNEALKILADNYLYEDNHYLAADPHMSDYLLQNSSCDQYLIKCFLGNHYRAHNRALLALLNDEYNMNVTFPPNWLI